MLAYAGDLDQDVLVSNDAGKLLVRVVDNSCRGVFPSDKLSL